MLKQFSTGGKRNNLTVGTIFFILTISNKNIFMFSYFYESDSRGFKLLNFILIKLFGAIISWESAYLDSANYAFIFDISAQHKDAFNDIDRDDEVI